MKLLVLGIDAGVKRVFQSFDMPFLQKKLKEERDIKVTEDIITRGWVRSYTGKSAHENLGFYEYPLIDKGGFEWSKSYNQNHLKSTGVQPIWELLNQNKISSGFMNIPTTSPVPEVDGFFIGGGGGGKELKGGFDTSICFPQEYSAILEENKYVIDERVPSLVWEKGIHKYDAFFETLINMTEKRLQTFIDLYDKKPVDLGFLVIRSVAVVHYLAMSEIENFCDGKPPMNRDLLENLKKFYKKLDNSIEKLFSKLQPEDYIIFTDHGITTLRENININKFLSQQGFQKSKLAKGSSKKVITAIKHLVPYKLRRKIKRSSSFKEHYMSMVSFDITETKAFSRGAVNGVYINDKERFNGPVAPEDIEKTIDALIDSFNTNEEFKKRNITAKKFNAKYNPKVKYYKYLPDIVLDNVKGLRFTEIGNTVFLTNKFASTKYALKQVKDDNWTGIKDPDTLLNISNTLYERSQDLIKQDNDLTLVYNLIKRNFNL